MVFALILPEIADFSEVWRTLLSMTWLETIFLLVAAGWNLVTYWILLMVAVPGLRLKQAFMVTQAATAVSNTLPGGPAFGAGVAYSMYTSWGYDKSTIALALMITGVGDLFAKLIMPVIAVVALSLYGDADAPLITVAIVGSTIASVATVAFVFGLSSDRAARSIGRWVADISARWRKRASKEPHADLETRFVAFRAQTAALLQGRWSRVLGAGVLSHVSLYVVLLIALRNVGVSETEVGWAEALGAFSLVRFLSAIPLTPGGLGVVELGLTAALVVAGGGEEPVVAAVLIYRALTFLLQVPIGGVAYLLWRYEQSGSTRSGVADPDGVAGRS